MTADTSPSQSAINRIGARIDRPIVLVGLMGAGKSTVGRRLAVMLGRSFVDADEAIEAAAQRSIAEIFADFGEAHFRENLRYIEDALGKDIRKYFTKDFYADHVKRYKKRPIYWMFSSPKGTFNALIYMHRYQSDTVSVLLNDYVRESITKLEGERAGLDKLADDPTATQGQKTKALKDVAAVAKLLSI